MTLQEIADYAMDYLDSKGVAADYEIKRVGLSLPFDHPAFKNEGERNCVIVVHANGNNLKLSKTFSKEYIKAMIDAHLTPSN